ncbi:MAG TPA: S8 family serine peptidase [Solirubrobacteraceae bacterium]|nr:S8 family serine peptidase [Solirubrobacteraceae bacterium]
MAPETVKTRSRRRAWLAAAAAAMLLLLCGQASAAETRSPLPESDYSVRAVCPPPAPGEAACMALALVPRTEQARAHTHPLGVLRASSPATHSAAAGDFGLRPQDLHSAYDLPTSAPSTQTIALVDAFNDLTAEEDLATYDTEFALPQCTAASGCFKKVNENGETGNPPFPATQSNLTKEETACKGHSEEACELVADADRWTVEMSLDVETAHAICQSCKIVLVEADTPSYANLETAENTAARLSAQEISNSWGGPECIEGECEADTSPFDHPGIVITASAGDEGYLDWLAEPRSPYANYPASLPDVVAVGGTRLLLGEDGERAGETVWNDGGESEGSADGYGAGGSGCSVQFLAKPWQRAVSDWSRVGCGGARAVADVAADADPYTGVAVYDSNRECESTYSEGPTQHTVHWCTIGGTSLASPLIAATFALAGGAHGVEFPARTLYENAAKSTTALYDVTEGSNGECLGPFDEETAETACEPAEEAQTSCSGQLICLAGPGYDGPTGLGTPAGLGAFEPPAQEAETETETGGGGEEPAPAPPALAPVVERSLRPPASVSSVSPPTQVRLAGLALTVKALFALNASHPKISQIGFTFVSNLAVRVGVSLQKLTSKHRHTRWRPLIRTLAVKAVSGRNSGRLTGRRALGAGTYRLLLTPANGAGDALEFKIG